MNELWAGLLGVVAGAAIAFAASYYYLSRRLRESSQEPSEPATEPAYDIHALADSFAAEIGRLVEGLRSYDEELKGNKYTVCDLGQPVMFEEPQFTEDDFKVLTTNVGEIGRFPSDTTWALVGFYYFLETLPERVREINESVRGEYTRTARSAVDMGRAYIAELDKALAEGGVLVDSLAALAAEAPPPAGAAPE